VPATAAEHEAGAERGYDRGYDRPHRHEDNR
jgi:hypothetical protein